MLYTNRVGYIENLYANAYCCKTTLDKSAKCFKNSTEALAKEKYCEFLEDKIKNPLAATLAMRDIKEIRPIENIEDFSKNLAKLEKTPEVDCYTKKIKDIESGYNKTGYVRQEIIAQNRISLNYVTPKLNKMEKLAFKLKLMF